MSGLRNPFGMRNGKMILIEDLPANERGLSCGCQCPACGGDFIARMGNIKVHHFAHSKEACDEIIAYTAGLYKLIHQILSDGTAFYVPSLVVSYQLPNNRILDEKTVAQFVKPVRENSKEPNKKMVSKGRSISFDSVELSYDSKNHIQAIELSRSGKKMAVKVMPPDTICKYATVSPHNDMATLVLDFANDADKIQTAKSEDFRQYLFSEKLCKYWIFNPLQETIYPLLLEKNKNDYADYLEQQKRIENAIEKQKQLDEERRAAAHEQQKRINEERVIARQQKISNEKERDILAYESVKDKFTQQTEKIIDCYGNRWFQCEKCGEIKMESEFWSYGGENRVNLGSCYDCYKIRGGNTNEPICRH